MSYPSLLFLNEPSCKTIAADLFEDLKLTMLIPETVIASMRKPCEPDDLLARQAMFAELQDPAVRAQFEMLHADMEVICRYYQFLNESESDNERNVVFVSLLRHVLKFYCDAATCSGKCAFFERFTSYFKSPEYVEMCAHLTCETDRVYELIAQIANNSVLVKKENVRITTQTAVSYEERLSRCAEEIGLDPVTPAKPLSRKLSKDVAEHFTTLYPEQFAQFASFYQQNASRFDATIIRYADELQFYLAIDDLTNRIRQAGIPAIFPKIAQTKQIDVRDAYDITLLEKNETNIVPNDIQFTVEEPFFYLTGANGGGKTTYLRTFGVLVTLFLNGCPVPCRSAEIFPFSCIYTHFPKDERFDENGRFVNEQKRVLEIMDDADGNALILFNETYSTTVEEKAVRMTSKLAKEIYHSGNFGIYITHQYDIDENEVPFLNVMIDVNNENRRTYKISRRKGTSGSYANDILKKYHLTGEALNVRFPLQ